MAEKKYQVCLCTCPDMDVADKIAQALLDKKLAACVNIVPQIISKYRWKGKIETDNELLLLIKTSCFLFDEVEKIIKEIHPYEVFELIAIKIDQGNKEYLNWLDESLINN